jgi:hypothetical protein
MTPEDIAKLVDICDDISDKYKLVAETLEIIGKLYFSVVSITGEHEICKAVVKQANANMIKAISESCIHDRNSKYIKMASDTFKGMIND